MLLGGWGGGGVIVCFIALSVVINFSHFRLLPLKRNSANIDRKQDLNVLYKVCVNRANRKKKKQDDRPGILLTATFSTSPLKALNGNLNETWKEARSQRPLPSLWFFEPIGKTRWPPRSLIDWDILNFSSVTSIWNSTKLGRKQDLNVLYQGCVFPADWKNKMATPASDWLRHYRLLLWNRWMEFNKIHRKQDFNVFYHVCVFRVYRRNKIAAPACDWLRHFRFLLWNHWMEFNKIWQDARSQRPLISLCFSGRSEEKDGRPASDLPRHFDFSSVTAEQDSTKLDRKQDLSVLYQFVIFGPIKKAALASDWLRHFRPLLCDRWTEFNETWQEANFQRRNRKCLSQSQAGAAILFLR